MKITKEVADHLDRVARQLVSDIIYADRQNGHKLLNFGATSLIMDAMVRAGLISRWRHNREQHGIETMGVEYEN